MKLTIDNYGQLFDSVKNQLPAHLVDNAEGYLEIADIIDAADAGTRQDVQDFIDKCNAYIKEDAGTQEKPKKEPKPRKPRTPKEPKEPKEKKAKAKKEAKVDNRTEVERKSDAVRIIARFAKLNGKTVCVTTKDEARRILATLQKAAINKQIRKTDEYAQEIMDIQNSLLKILKLTSGSIEIAAYDHYKEIADGYKISRPASLIRQYINIQGKEGVKSKAKTLLEKVTKVLNAGNSGDKYFNEIHTIYNSLMDYTEGKTDTPEMSEMALNGLYGIAGIECKPKSGVAINSREFLGATFRTLPFTGKWKRLIGIPEEHFRIMIYGKAGSGKSTLALQFAKYLCTLGKRVLYIADEEKYGYTLQDKIARLNVADSNLSIFDRMPTNKREFENYDIIFIDSVNSVGLDAEQLRKIAPSKSFVYVFQTTKDGRFRGENTYEHDVDAVVRVEEMSAETEKNRFGGKDTIRII